MHFPSIKLFVTTAALVSILAAGCKPRPLPEENSPAAQLYAHQCGQCHSPYNPQAMTAAMWEVEVPKMEQKIHQAGLPALDVTTKQAILEYLARNAGTE